MNSESLPEGEGLQLSIIIVSFNTREITAACLNSIRDAGIRLGYEVLVVDNASSDGSPEMIERDFPEVSLIRNPENLMFAKANNRAMRVARGEQILLLNSDTLVHPGAVEALFDFIRRAPETTGCVGPRVLNRDGSIQSEGEAFDSYCYVISSILGVEKLPLPGFIKDLLLPPGYPRRLTGCARKVGWVTGCCMMFPRKIIGRVGDLDESFVFYCEEVEFCYRLKRHGFETWVVPEAQITHLGGASLMASKKMELLNQPELPDYHARRFLLHQKTGGVRRKIRLNRLRILIFSAALPVVRLLRPSMVPQIVERIEFHAGENRRFIKELADQPTIKN